MFYYDENIVSDTDRVRFLVGDTEEESALLGNGEIAYCLTLGNNNVLLACAHACDAIAAKKAKHAIYRIRGQSTEVENVWRAYKELAKGFREKAKSASSFYALVTVADLQTFRSDTSLIPPIFSVGMHDTGEASVRDKTTDWD